MSDVNELYQRNFVEPSLEFDKDTFLLDDKARETRFEVYKSLSALQGLSDPVRDAVTRRRRGILRQVVAVRGRSASSTVQQAFFQETGEAPPRPSGGVIAVGPELGGKWVSQTHGLGDFRAS